MMQFSTTGLDFPRFCSALRSQLKQRRGNKAVARVLLSSFEHRLIRFTTVVILLLCCSGIYAAEPELDAYKLGPEDVVTVVVSRHPEFSGDYYIPSDGVINIVAVGRINVTGKTLDELAAIIIEKLSDRLREPEVTAILKTPRMQRVYVLCSVDRPGLYDVKPGWRVTEALAAAGGLIPGIEPSDCTAIITKYATNERKTVKLTDALSGDVTANLPLDSGDILTIEAQATFPVYVMGKVRNPGLYRIRTDSAGLMEAITLAGGALEDASLERVTVTHIDGTSEVFNLVPWMTKGEQAKRIPIRASDLITVPEEISRVAVLGYVNQPGFYTLKSGQKLTLVDVLGLAKGVDDKNAKTSEIAVIRTKDGKQERLTFDLKKFLKSGDLEHNPEILPGDVVYVPKSGRADWDQIFRSLSSVALILNPLVN